MLVDTVDAVDVHCYYAIHHVPRFARRGISCTIVGIEYAESYIITMVYGRCKIATDKILRLLQHGKIQFWCSEINPTDIDGLFHNQTFL